MPHEPDDRRKGSSRHSRRDSGQPFLKTTRSRIRRLFGKLPLPDEDREPIDLASPSVPYYTNLSRRFRLAQIVLYLVLFVFVVTAVLGSRERITYANLYYLVKDINAASLVAEDAADRLEYPASSTTTAFVRYRGGLVAVGNQEVTVLSGSGRQTMTAQVEYGTPAVSASEKYFITYGLGEHRFSVFNAFTQVHSEVTDFPVYGAAVADDGSFLIVTRSETYTSRIIFYDRDHEVRANYYLNGYALSAAVSPDGGYAAVTSIDVEDGRYVSKVNIFRLSGSITYETVEPEGGLVGLCGFPAEDRVAVACADRLLVLRTDGTVQIEWMPEGGSTLSLCAVSSGRIALLSRLDGESYRVTVLDKNGRMVYTRRLRPQAEPTALAFGENVLYLRAGGFLYRLSADGDDLSYVRIHRDSLCILPDDGESVLVCATTAATRLYTNQFITADKE